LSLPTQKLAKKNIVANSKICSKTYVTTDSEIDSKNCVVADSKISKKNCIAFDPEIDNENCVDVEIDNDGGVVSGFTFFFIGCLHLCSIFTCWHIPHLDTYFAISLFMVGHQ